jgi:hypothetical protein
MRFAKIAPHRLVGSEEALPRELLGDRAAALRDTAMADVRQPRRHNPDGVEAMMVVIPLIFDRNQRVHQIRRDLFERHFDPLLFEDGEDERVRGVIHRRGLVHLADPLDGVLIGKPASQIRGEPEGEENGEDCSNRRRGEKDRDQSRLFAMGRTELFLQISKAIAKRQIHFSLKPCNSRATPRRDSSYVTPRGTSVALPSGGGSSGHQRAHRFRPDDSNADGVCDL